MTLATAALPSPPTQTRRPNRNPNQNRNRNQSRNPSSSLFPQGIPSTSGLPLLASAFIVKDARFWGTASFLAALPTLYSKKACSRAFIALITFLLPTTLARKDPTVRQRRSGVRPTKAALRPNERNPRRKKRRRLAPNACALLRVENTSTVKGAAFWWAETFLAALPTLCSRKAFCRASIALVDY